MDSFGGYDVHRGEMPAQFKPKLHAGMADIQVSEVRFAKIGSIIKVDGGYSVGPIPGIGGPFECAAQFFQAWASHVKFPFSDELVRERTPAGLVDDILRSIHNVPSAIRDLAQIYDFRKGPYPLVHPDLYTSNVIIDSQCNLLSVIDWEDAFVGPWEMVEYVKDLCIVPPALDGPLYRDTEAARQRQAECKEYVELVKRAERTRGCDECLSQTLADTPVQYLTNAIWLYEIDGRIGFYDRIFDLLTPIE